MDPRHYGGGFQLTSGWHRARRRSVQHGEERVMCWRPAHHRAAMSAREGVGKNGFMAVKSCLVVGWVVRQPCLCQWGARQLELMLRLLTGIPALGQNYFRYGLFVVGSQTSHSQVQVGMGRVQHAGSKRFKTERQVLETWVCVHGALSAYLRFIAGTILDYKAEKWRIAEDEAFK
eukprot:5635430-Amphidinium_carterae.1